MIYSDGTIYQGQWKYGMKNGKGTLIKDGLTFTGLFMDDKMIGPNWKEDVDDYKLSTKLVENLLSRKEWKERKK